MGVHDRLEPLRRLAGKGVYPPAFAWMLTLPVRRLILSPAVLADRLRLSPDDRVLEIGPGPGYFSVEVARRLRPGHLTLLDVQPEMLQKARRRLSRSGVQDVTYVAGDAAALPFPDASFDVVFLVTVLGEVVERERAAAEISRVMAPGGRLSITEAAGDPDRLTPDDLAALFGPVGFASAGSVGGRGGLTSTFVRSMGGAPSNGG